MKKIPYTNEQSIWEYLNDFLGPSVCNFLSFATYYCCHPCYYYRYDVPYVYTIEFAEKILHVPSQESTLIISVIGNRVFSVIFKVTVTSNFYFFLVKGFNRRCSTLVLYHKKWRWKWSNVYKFSLITGNILN